MQNEVAGVQSALIAVVALSVFVEAAFHSFLQTAQPFVCTPFVDRARVGRAGVGVVAGCVVRGGGAANLRIACVYRAVVFVAALQRRALEAAVLDVAHFFAVADVVVGTDVVLRKVHDLIGLLVARIFSARNGIVQIWSFALKAVAFGIADFCAVAELTIIARGVVRCMGASAAFKANVIGAGNAVVTDDNVLGIAIALLAVTFCPAI